MYWVNNELYEGYAFCTLPSFRRGNAFSAGGLDRSKKHHSKGADCCANLGPQKPEALDLQPFGRASTILLVTAFIS